MPAPSTTNTTSLRLDEIDSVVFDIGGVFAIRHPDAVVNGMGRAGFTMPTDPARYHDAHYHAVRALSDLLHDESGFETGVKLSEYDKSFWEQFERRYLTRLGVADDRLDAAVESMFTEVFAKEPKPIWREVLSVNVTGFVRISRKYPVGIVTNNDGTAEAQLQAFGICQLGVGPLTEVKCIVDSGVVGIAKPDPAIFLPALAAMGTAPSRTLYVGDTVHADVVGAEAAGMQVVQLDPYGLHDHFTHARVPDVNALADILGAS